MIVVADTSVLLNLGRVEQIELLRGIFHEIVIPLEVAAEFLRLSGNTARFQGLTLPNWIRQQSATAILPSVRTTVGLDAGEAAAISLAVEIHADAILIDERRGHLIASQLGLKTIGLLGILIQAKAIGLLPAVLPVIERLERDAGFWLSVQLRERVLRIAGE